MQIRKMQHGILVLVVEDNETKETIENSMFEHAISFEVTDDKLFIVDNFNNINYLYANNAEEFLEYHCPEEDLLEYIQQKEKGCYFFPDEW